VVSDEASQLGTAAARRLAEYGCCEIEPGLTAAEINDVEHRYGFEFADDHRVFLMVGLPVWQPYEDGQTWLKPWPDWRDGDPDELREHLAWPVEFLLDDVRRGHLRNGRGARPDEPDEAFEVARRFVAGAPTMVPVYAHRFLPAGHGTFGHPVLSMWGRDIIYYGTDLLDHVTYEFAVPQPDRPDGWDPQATVAFWRDGV
jgi:hypothetical protein